MSQPEPTTPDTTTTEAPTSLSQRDEPDGVTFLDKTLRVRLRLGSQEYTLPAPTLGVFKEFRRRLSEVDENVRVAAAENDPHASEMQADGVVDVVGWLVKTLTARDLPPDRDSYPTWMGSIQLTQSLVAHWQKVPLLSGTSDA